MLLTSAPQELCAGNICTCAHVRTRACSHTDMCMQMKQQIPNDIPIHGQFIPSCNLRSQKYIEEIHRWTQHQEMLISEKKTKSMIINYTDNYQFHTRLTLNTKLLKLSIKSKFWEQL